MIKITFLTAALMLVTGTSAHATFFKTITCHNVKSPSHKLSIEFLKKIPSSQWWEDKYLAQIATLHGPRLPGEVYQNVVTVSNISTRIEAGKSYSVKLQDGSQISLKHITYSAYSEPAKFTGSVIYLSGNIVSLNCSLNKL